MQLIYRSVTYQATTKLVQTVETNITATFLGSNYRLRRPINLYSSQYCLKLKFRGVEYAKDETNAIEPLIESMQVSPTKINLNQTEKVLAKTRR